MYQRSLLDRGPRRADPPSMSDRDQMLDIRQAAELLNVSETSLRRWTNAGQLACLRVGRKRERRFRRADRLAFMEEQPRPTQEGVARGQPVYLRHSEIDGIPVS